VVGFKIKRIQLVEGYLITTLCSITNKAKPSITVNISYIVNFIELHFPFKGRIPLHGDYVMCTPRTTKEANGSIRRTAIENMQLIYC
jgi:hypothetical protein